MAADELALVEAARAGDRAAAEALLRAAADPVWAVCARLCEGAAAREAFAFVMAGLGADGFRRFHAFAGRGRLATFAALLARELLATRLLRLLREDGARAWLGFEAMFGADIRRLLARRLPGAAHEEARRDLYQDVCLAFVAEDYRRLRAYSGAGSFAGFVLHAADRLAIDALRAASGRRRPPAAIARLGTLDQAVFRRVHWQGLPAEPALLATALAGHQPPPAPPDIAAALARVDAALGSRPAGESLPPPRLIELAEAPELSEDGAAGGPATPSPEEDAIAAEAERALAAAATTLRRVAAALPADERLYLEAALGGAQPLPARAVARLLGRPVAEVYKLKARLLPRLRAALAEDGAVKNWRASVSPGMEERPSP